MCQELIKSLTDGEVILLAVQDATNRTLPQTSPVGHVALRQQIKGLSHDWDKLKLGVKETEQSLLHAVDATETYDSTCQLLSQWLRETEAQFKDYEMRSTLAEKQAELKMFEVMSVLMCIFCQLVFVTFLFIFLCSSYCMLHASCWAKLSVQ